MAVRPVDAEKYMELLKEQYLHHEAMGNKQVAKAWQGAMQLLYDMPTLTPPNEWVSVDNKLPKNGVPVLIGNPHWDYPVVASCAGYGVWMDSWHQKMTFTPTCWMPLPAPFNHRPPEGEEDT